MTLKYLNEWLVLKTDYVSICGLEATLIGSGDRLNVTFESAFDTRTNAKVGDRSFIVTVEALHFFIIDEN